MYVRSHTHARTPPCGNDDSDNLEMPAMQLSLYRQSLSAFSFILLLPASSMTRTYPRFLGYLGEMREYSIPASFLHMFVAMKLGKECGGEGDRCKECIKQEAIITVPDGRCWGPC